ncbi:MAG: DUF2306 domain-containing protein [Saprospiraceae bacterium]|nr:DUF2306 domain-containing protein [Saprospiraceae bacterium]
MPTSRITTILWPLAILFFSYQFILIIAPYTSWKWDVDFLITKQHIIHLDYYRAAFYAHIFSSMFVLASGVFLFPKYVLHKWPKLHRYAGRIYVGLLLLVSAPSGFIMAFHANGGWAAQASFFILTPLWWWVTWKGFDTARKRQFAKHKSWMLRSYALTLSAVSLRVYQLLLGQFFYLDPVVQYVLVSWAAWVGNLVFAEWMIWKQSGSRSKVFAQKLRAFGGYFGNLSRAA